MCPEKADAPLAPSPSALGKTAGPCAPFNVQWERVLRVLQRSSSVSSEKNFSTCSSQSAPLVPAELLYMPHESSYSTGSAPFAQRNGSKKAATVNALLYVLSETHGVCPILLL